MAEEKGKHLPQHFVHVGEPLVPKSSLVKEWPKEWKENPEVLKIVSEHQGWLGQVTTQKLKSVLDGMINTLVNEVSSMSVSFAFSSESVRVKGAQLSNLLKLKKVIYDTEEFVKECINGR